MNGQDNPGSNDLSKNVKLWMETMRRADRSYAENNLEEAESSYNQALEQANNMKECCVFSTESLSALGWFLREQGRYNEAETVYKQRVMTWQNELNIEHPALAVSFTKLGDFYNIQGRYLEAIEYYLKAVALREKQKVYSFMEHAGTLEKLARAYSTAGDMARAVKYFEKTLEEKEKACGDTHPSLIITLKELSMQEHLRGDETKSVAYLSRASGLLTEYSEEITTMSSI